MELRRLGLKINPASYQLCGIEQRWLQRSDPRVLLCCTRLMVGRSSVGHQDDMGGALPMAGLHGDSGRDDKFFSTL